MYNLYNEYAVKCLCMLQSVTILFIIALCSETDISNEQKTTSKLTLVSFVRV